MPSRLHCLNPLNSGLRSELVIMTKEGMFTGLNPLNSGLRSEPVLTGWMGLFGLGLNPLNSGLRSEPSPQRRVQWGNWS